MSRSVREPAGDPSTRENAGRDLLAIDGSAVAAGRSGTATSSHVSLRLTRATPAGARTLYVAAAVPGQPPDVQCVVQDAVASIHLASNCGVGPGPTARTWNGVAIECAGYVPRRFACRAVAENASDDLGLRFLDPTSAGFVDARRRRNDLIAASQSARNPP